MVQKYTYYFGKTRVDGNATMKAELGGKGANLAEMLNLKLPVPPGFTISTSVCAAYFENRNAYPKNLVNEVDSCLSLMEAELGSRFGDSTAPLLVSVRSGARVSMPGMMDTILNLGLNDITVEALAKNTHNPRFAYDCYRRFIQMFAEVVKNVDAHLFADALEQTKTDNKVTQDCDLSAEHLKGLVKQFQHIYQQKQGEPFPQSPKEQLWAAIGAVFESWHCDRAKKYRQIHDIPEHWGTAVNICSMVYGNKGNTSGTGVCFTRDPSTGENVFYGEYLINAQGEDVVAGIRTPKPLALLATEMPKVYEELDRVRNILEHHYRDVQDIEFTIEEGNLYILQTRNAKRSAQAALKIALDFIKEGILNKTEALLRLQPRDLDQLLHPTLDPKAFKQIIARGLPASPGAASGRVVFRAIDAEAWAARGEKVILVRDETSPEDIGGMFASQGFLTARGGMTSHAAVVARQMGKCCVAGCQALSISASHNITVARIGSVEVREGDWLTLDGAQGEVILGKISTREVELSKDFNEFMDIAREVQGMGVRANADTPQEAKLARKFGAKGIGLCRTEHMFFHEERLPIVRRMILAISADERIATLEKLLPFQREDFVGIMEAMEGYPVTVRLLDPPLHEFLPQNDEEMKGLALAFQMDLNELKIRVGALEEVNPMLGHRGCRLGISHPEIYDMQVKAIMQATVQLRAQGKRVFPEIMIPLVGLESELQWLRERLVKFAKQIYDQEAQRLGANIEPFSIPMGTMIEVPRAALTAKNIAKHADFFSFGTNDLTQTTYGFSRDDSAAFLKLYQSKGILQSDPFEVLDRDGVGMLVEMATRSGRSVNPTLKVGICGEHGGEPQSIAFCHQTGLDYVSCSPYRVPVAILAAAQCVPVSESQ